MNATFFETRSAEAAAYGGLVDAIGGIATAVLAIVALTGFDPRALAGVATIVFGAALLIQGGTLLSEYSSLVLPSGANASSAATESLAGDGLSAMLIVGVAGVALGVLALLGIESTVLTASAVIAFGGALVVSASSASHLYQLQTAMRRGSATQSGYELLAGQMAAGSGGVQLLTGLTAIVLGILAVSGVYSDALTLAALLVLGIAVIMTGSTLSGMVRSFVRPT
ncbi:MAG TPA: hypothetical protein VMD03_03410 [Steroidobacteraceae bacterium]|nr:hypothetical protein [Steroidobacteraceae bacterium]